METVPNMALGITKIAKTQKPHLPKICKLTQNPNSGPQPYEKLEVKVLKHNS